MAESKKMGLTISIDTSVANGSFSLWNRGSEISYKIGKKEVSRSEDILEILTELLHLCKFKPDVIEQIIYTNGPGSYTGLRVGVSTVLGLKNSLKCPIYPVSVFEAFSTASFQEGIINTALFLHRNRIATQKFNRSDNVFDTGPIKYYNIEDFIYELNKGTEQYIIDKRINGVLINVDIEPTRTINASDNVASLAYQFYIRNLKKVTRREHSIIYASEL